MITNDGIAILSDKITEQFVLFSTGVNVQMLINRNIQNANKGSRRWINKLISNSPTEFKRNIEVLLFQQRALANPYIRLYSSVNCRDLHKTVKKLHHAMVDMSYQDEETFFSRINDNFISLLMKPENRMTKFFLLDYDSELGIDMFEEILSENKILLIHKYKTVKGWHYITSPFNPALLTDTNTCEVKKDALLLLHHLPLKEANHELHIEDIGIERG